MCHVNVLFDRLTCGGSKETVEEMCNEMPLTDALCSLYTNEKKTKYMLTQRPE